MRSFPRLQRKLKRRQDMEIFQQILSLDSETTATKYSEITLNQDEEGNDLDNDEDTDESATSTNSSRHDRSSGTLNEGEELRKRLDTSLVTDDIEENDGVDQYMKAVDDRRHREGRRSASLDIAFPVPRFNLTSIDDCTQTSTPMEEILRNTELEKMRPLEAVDKITEWMKSNEFERIDSLTVETGDSCSLSAKSYNDDRMNTELIEQDIDLADTPDLDYLFGHNNDRQREFVSDTTSTIESDFTDIPLPVRNFFTKVTAPEDQFDDSATYSSLQFAFENPIQIPDVPKGSVKIVTTPEITVEQAQPPQTPPSPPLPLPPRTPSPVPEQILPPLPPKRKASRELDITFTSTDHVLQNRQTYDESPTPDTHVVAPDIDKEIEASAHKTFCTITSTPKESPPPSPNKKMGFISRFFTRRRSKPEPTIPAGNQTREPSICNFSLNEAIRGSVRSLRSLQFGPIENTSPKKTSGKPVGRSASSVSGKSPAHREGDIIHIPLKGPRPIDRASYAYGDSGEGLLDQRSLSALQLANVPLSDGNLELVAIADREGIKRLSQAEYNICLESGTNLNEVDNFALFTVKKTSKENVDESGEDEVFVADASMK